VYSLYKETGRLSEDAKRLLKLKSVKKQAFRLGKIGEEKDVVLERHRHRYEVNPKFVEQISAKGLVFSGHHIRLDDTKLMEFIELPDHPYFVATQAHPEFKSSLENPAPLFYGFIRAAMK
jgi:CTP synthase